MIFGKNQRILRAVKKKSDVPLDIPLLEREVGSRVKAARINAALSQSQLSQKAKINRTSLIQLEKGEQQISIRQLYAISDALAMDPRDLLPEISTIKDSSKRTYKNIQIDNYGALTVSDLEYVFENIIEKEK